jgi:tetratricopeptide (TPR) repeat protein
MKVAGFLSKGYISTLQFRKAGGLLHQLAQYDNRDRSWALAGKAFADAVYQTNDSVEAKKLQDLSNQDFQKALDLNPENSTAKIGKAIAIVNSNSPMDGIMMLREVIEKEPENELAGFYLGTLSMKSGQFEKAVERFKKVVEVNPLNFEAQLYLGVSYYRINQKEQAEKIFMEVKKDTKDQHILSAVELYLNEMNSSNL